MLASFFKLILSVPRKLEFFRSMPENQLRVDLRKKLKIATKYQPASCFLIKKLPTFVVCNFEIIAEFVSSKECLKEGQLKVKLCHNVLPSYILKTLPI